MHPPAPSPHSACRRIATQCMEETLMHSTDARPHLRCGPLCRHYSKIGMGTFLPAVAAYVPAPPRPPAWLRRRCARDRSAWAQPRRRPALTPLRCGTPPARAGRDCCFPLFGHGARHGAAGPLPRIPAPEEAAREGICAPGAAAADTRCGASALQVPQCDLHVGPSSCTCTPRPAPSASPTAPSAKPLEAAST